MSRKTNKLFRSNMEKLTMTPEQDEQGFLEDTGQIALQKLLRKLENTEFSSLIPKLRLTTDFGALFDELIKLKDMKEGDEEPKAEAENNGMNSIGE